MPGYLKQADLLLFLSFSHSLAPSPVKQRAGVENKYVKPSDLMTFEASPVRWESEKESFWKRRWNILLRRSGEELRSVSKVNNYNILSHFLESGQKKIIAPSLIGNFLCLQSRISHVAFHGVVPSKKKKNNDRKKERKKRKEQTCAWRMHQNFRWDVLFAI